MARTTAFKWRAILGLIILSLAVWYDWQWMWGVLFLLWVIPDLITGESYYSFADEGRMAIDHLS